MTTEQLQHYLKGGIFRAVYQPKVTHDLAKVYTHIIGKEVEVNQNMIITPTPISQYPGQHAFNFRSYELPRGWFPEEDIEILEMLDEYIEHPEPLPQYMYRMTYTDRDQVRENFGIGYENHPLPMVITRAYNTDKDDYVLNRLSNPKATKVEKAIWDGTADPEWKIIYQLKEQEQWENSKRS